MKLLGNRVLVEPLPDSHPGSLIARTVRYDPDPMIYLIVAVAVGVDGWIWPGRKCLLNPAVSTRHAAGEGRFIVEAADILMVWV